MIMRTTITLACVALCGLGLAMQEAPRKQGGQGGQGGRGGKSGKPPQDGIVKPEMRDTIKGAKWIWTGDLDLDNTVLFRKRIEKPGTARRWTTKPDLDTAGSSPVK